MWPCHMDSKQEITEVVEIANATGRHSFTGWNINSVVAVKGLVHFTCRMLSRP